MIHLLLLIQMILRTKVTRTVAIFNNELYNNNTSNVKLEESKRIIDTWDIFLCCSIMHLNTIWNVFNIIVWRDKKCFPNITILTKRYLAIFLITGIIKMHQYFSDSRIFIFIFIYYISFFYFIFIFIFFLSNFSCYCCHNSLLKIAIVHVLTFARSKLFKQILPNVSFVLTKILPKKLRSFFT